MRSVGVKDYAVRSVGVVADAVRAAQNAAEQCALSTFAENRGTLPPVPSGAGPTAFWLVAGK